MIRWGCFEKALLCDLLWRNNIIFFLNLFFWWQVNFLMQFVTKYQSSVGEAANPKSIHLKGKRRKRKKNLRKVCFSFFLPNLDDNVDIYFFLCIWIKMSNKLNLNNKSYHFLFLFLFSSLSHLTDLSLGSFRNGKEKVHRGNHNNLHDITTTNPFHFYTNPKWYESYFDPIIPRNVSSLNHETTQILNEFIFLMKNHFSLSFLSLSFLSGYGISWKISIFKL